VLPDFPDVRVDRVNVLENPEAFHALGLKRYPALACGDRTLSALFLTKRKIRRFLHDL
jgi:hypothetical protein